MLDCFTHKLQAIPIFTLNQEDLKAWLAEQPDYIKAWVDSCDFKAKSQEVLLCPDERGNLFCVLYGVKFKRHIWDYAGVFAKLPAHHTYTFTDKSVQPISALAWALSAYQYKRDNAPKPQLHISEETLQAVDPAIQAVYWARTLINTPPNLMGPQQLLEQAKALKYLGAEITSISGDALKEHYPAIYAVGQASQRLPRLIDIQWGEPSKPTLVLVGKGVCFDTGGLDIKPSSNMRLMKKDMGGAACVLGLAKAIMMLKLPVNLKVYIPAVENSISGSSYRPSDVIQTRKGISVEIDNTDAEGRVCLADALARGCEQSPDLVIDFATLTGAARIALGTDIPVYFTPNDHIADEIQQFSSNALDPMWRLPLYQGYEQENDSLFADIKNSGSSGYGGAITAALFLKRFVDTTDWVHIDLMGWNLTDRPGRPTGGEAMGVRGILSYLTKRYQSS